MQVKKQVYLLYKPENVEVSLFFSDICFKQDQLRARNI